MGNYKTDAIWQHSVKELTSAYKSRDLTPVDAARAALQRAEEVDAVLNAFTVIDHDGAIASARVSQERWRRGAPLSPIDGIPTTIKDIVWCHGLDVRYGSRATPDSSSKPDSPSVQRLRNAGAVILGLTITPEFGWKAVTDNPKDGVARNPWDHAKTPGGSSGGAAIAAATGAGVLHLGTDGGGSVRIPSSFTGIVGLKPSYGRVAAYPASSFGTVAHIGPMARTVEDAAAMLNAMAGRDLRDWTQPVQEFPELSLSQVNWSGKRVGYWKTPCIGGVDKTVAEAIERVLKDLELAGASVTEIQLPDQEALEIFLCLWYVGAANRLSWIDPGQHDLIDPGFLRVARIGQRYSAVDRMQAEIRRAQFGARMDALLDEFAYLVSPTVPIPAFCAGSEVPEGSGFESSFEWSSFSFPINLSQQPACSVPCGFTPDGLPIGMQIVGPRGADGSVLSAALTYQHMYPERFLIPGGKWPALDGRRDWCSPQPISC
ncbi:amidase [Mesorhizobium sp. M0045]|uniref:amidase n=1 Tax=Mesorhizobium sp. M0045 TaxID=2956857 RepID=UPI00333C6D9E